MQSKEITADSQVARIFEWRRGFNTIHLIDVGIRTGLFKALDRVARGERVRAREQARPARSVCRNVVQDRLRNGTAGCGRWAALSSGAVLRQHPRRADAPSLPGGLREAGYRSSRGGLQALRDGVAYGRSETVPRPRRRFRTGRRRVHLGPAGGDGEEDPAGIGRPRIAPRGGRDRAGSRLRHGQPAGTAREGFPARECRRCGHRCGKPRAGARPDREGRVRRARRRRVREVWPRRSRRPVSMRS